MTKQAANQKRTFKPKYFINYVLIGAMLIGFSVEFSTGMMDGSTARLLTQIGYSIVLALSLNLVVGFLGELSLGHAGFMCAGAYIGCYFANSLHEVVDSKLLVLVLSMLVGGAVAALLGLVIGLPTLRLKGDYLAIVTLAFGEIVRTIFKNQEAFGGAMGLATKKFGQELFIPALIVALLTVLVCQNLMRSKHGRAVQAIRDNEIAARAMGVNVTYYKLVIFVISAFFAGVAGVLYGHNTTPVDYSFFSFNYSIEILVMVVLGGMGSLTGSIVAATILTYINMQLTALPGELAALKNLIYALILILLVMWNNAPMLRNIREKISLTRLLEKRRKKRAQDGGVEAPETAHWDKIPTKIPMDAILSTDVLPDENAEADDSGRGEDAKNG